MQFLNFVFISSALAAFELTHVKLFQVKKAQLTGLDPVTNDFTIESNQNLGAFAQVAVKKDHELHFDVRGGAFISLIRDGAVAWPNNLRNKNIPLPADNEKGTMMLEKNDILVIVVPHGASTINRSSFYSAFDGVSASTYTAHVKAFCEPLSNKDFSVVSLYVKDANFADLVDFIHPLPSLQRTNSSPRKTVVVASNTPVVVNDVKQTNDVRVTGTGVMERKVVVQRQTTVLPGAGISQAHHNRKPSGSGGSIFQ